MSSNSNKKNILNIPEPIASIAPEIYSDIAKPTTSEIGKFAGRIPRLINAALAPLDIWIYKREYTVEKVKVLLEKELQSSDPEKIVPPEPYVAVPAIQALSYSMDSDELRKLYAKLLSKSIYSDTKESVHPAFVEIIKNLSPLDCQVFNLIMESNTQEIGCYEFRLGIVGDSSYHVIHPYVTEITIDEPDAIATSIDNLSRNKLINPKDFHYKDDTMYSQIRNTDFYKSIVQFFSTNPNNQELRTHEMCIQSTSFGKSFYKVCCVSL